MKFETKEIDLKFPTNLRFCAGKKTFDIRVVKVQAEVYKDIFAIHPTQDTEVKAYDVTHVPTGFKVVQTKTKTRAREIINKVLKEMTIEELSYTDTDSWMKDGYAAFLKFKNLVSE